MRIAYFLADHGIPVFSNKGASVHVREMAQALVNQGHELTIFCARHGEVTQSPDYVLCKTPDVGAMLADDMDDGPQSARRLKEKRYITSAQAMLNNFLKEHAVNPFDFVYERYSLWSSAAAKATELTGIPSLLEVNAPLLKEQSTFRQLVLSKEAEEVEREAFCGCTAVITVSREVANYVIEKGADSSKVSVIANAVNDSLFHPDTEPMVCPKMDGKFVVAFSGSLKQWHGVDVLMTAFRNLSRRLAGTHLLIIGDGPMRDWCDGFVAGAGLASSVTFTDWCPHEHIPQWIAKADVCVAPYPMMSDFYFSPLKLFEYLAMGKAVVASDLGQISDVITDRENGLLVHPGSASELTRALESLYVDREYRSALADKALVLAEGYTWRENARKVLELADSLMFYQKHQRRAK